VARDSTGTVVGSACCQVWEGPGSNNYSWQRLIKIGVVWGLYVDPAYRAHGVDSQLMDHIVARWRSTKCTKGFVMATGDDEARTFSALGFAPHNAMVVDLERPLSPRSPLTTFDAARAPPRTRRGVSERPPAACAAAAAPASAASARRSGCNVPTSTSEMEPASAGDSNVPPVSETEATLAGGAGLTAAEAAFVTAVRSSDAELTGEIGAEVVRELTDRQLASLRLALPQMVEAAFPGVRAQPLRTAVAAAQVRHGSYVDGDWFTTNIARFGGGFDMRELTAQPGKLAAKFDRLSDKYDQWTVGNGCTYYHWLAAATRAASAELRAPDARIVDVACGIGLPGHMLRLCGFGGHMTGTDISPGMLSHARERRVYDRLLLANANEGLDAIDARSVDLLVCVGAMELLDHAAVLREFARILKPSGRVWLTFQAEDARDTSGAPVPNPTAHQHVHGVTRSQLEIELQAAGFDASSAKVTESSCAFYTPSPKQDGSLLPVPYLYVEAGLCEDV